MLSQVFPAVYALMTRKTAQSYLALFEYIEQKLFELDPKEMMTDFEKGMRKAIKICWPDVILRGCWFGTSGSTIARQYTKDASSMDSPSC